jgi:glucosamine--fructose-6-phosphate aminotransferase (isomerizing)
MCGIFGFSGKKSEAVTTIINGLKRLEYRGYDSWGLAVKVDAGLDLEKQIGEIGDIENISLEDSNRGIGHTRWATHGGVTQVNAHPHLSSDERFALAQNGIVENFQELKESLLEQGYEFISETDTEVIVRLIESKLEEVDELKEAVRLAFLELEGRNTIIVLDQESGDLYAIRDGSPLVVGVGGDAYYIASDTLSFADLTDKVVFVDDREMVVVDDEGVKIKLAETGKPQEILIKNIDHSDVKIDKEGYEHFMLKEIVEQKHTIREAIQYTEEDLRPLVEKVKSADTVYTVGAGTAAFAAGQIAYFLRKHARVRAIELRSYEMGSYSELFTENDLVLAVSQSGETADTVEALEIAKEAGAEIASIVNMVGSTITRMSDYAYLSRSGPEVCVASTKAFTAQVSWGFLLALTVSGKYEQAQAQVKKLAEELENYFSDNLFNRIKSIVPELKQPEHFFVLGKGQNFYISLEGALKIKEITYKHFEGFSAGELKHGVIALIEEGVPVFSIVSEDEHKSDLMSAIAEVKSRGAKTYVIGKEDNELFDEFIQAPDAGLLDSVANTIPFQLISYFLGVELGNSPDKPRNLAKSVTVK